MARYIRREGVGTGGQVHRKGEMVGYIGREGGRDGQVHKEGEMVG